MKSASEGFISTLGTAREASVSKTSEQKFLRLQHGVEKWGNKSR